MFKIPPIPSLKLRANERSGHELLREWYSNTASGRRVKQQIRNDIALILDEWFGYHMLVIGVDAGWDVAEMTRVQHLCHIVSDQTAKAHLPTTQHRNSVVISTDEALSIETESVDVVVLMNALELSQQPHEVLREAHRVLTPHGHLLVVGSNPNSLRGFWGRLHSMVGTRRRLPLGISATKLSDWLKLLHFSVSPIRHKLTLPLGGTGRIGRWLARIDNWLSEHNIPPGSSYVVYANKMVLGHISTQRTERVKARLMGLPVAKPVVGARGSAASRNENTPLRPVE